MNKAFFYAGTLTTVFGFCQQALAQETLFERAKITAPDTAAGDIFGHDVDVDNGIVIVSAPMDDDNGFNSGSAYLIDTTTGAIIEKITSGITGNSGLFGDSVALSGGLALAGIPNAFRTGAASVFDVEGNEVNQLLPFSPAPASPELSNFGFSVGISATGDNMVIGARSDTGQEDAGSNFGGGAIYLYDINGAVTKVFSSDAGFADNFGHSSAISDAYAVGSSPFDDDNGSSSGSIYVFDVNTTAETRKIVPADGAAGDLFGWQVAIDDTVIAAGTPFADEAGLDAGAVYLFDADTGAQLNKLTVPGTQSFGITLDLDGELLAVGSRERAHVFNITSGEMIAELLPSDASGAQAFGAAITIDGDTVVVGAQNDSTRDTNAGAVYVYDLSGQLPPIDPPVDDPAGTVSVASIDADVFTFTNRRGRLRGGAEVTIAVVNDSNQPVADATVTVEITGRISETLTGTTDASGTVVLRSETTRRVDRRPLTYTACVVDITGDLDYDPATNVETCARF